MNLGPGSRRCCAAAPPWGSYRRGVRPAETLEPGPGSCGLLRHARSLLRSRSPADRAAVVRGRIPRAAGAAARRFGQPSAPFGARHSARRRADPGRPRGVPRGAYAGARRARLRGAGCRGGGDVGWPDAARPSFWCAVPDRAVRGAGRHRELRRGRPAARRAPRVRGVRAGDGAAAVDDGVDRRDGAGADAVRAHDAPDVGGAGARALHDRPRGGAGVAGVTCGTRASTMWWTPRSRVERRFCRYRGRWRSPG